MADELPIPKSRTESYLAKAAGEDVPIPEEPRSRLEQYLNAIAENGGGGGGGGTSNFNQLTNRPKYNGSEMTSSTDIPEVKTYTAGSNISISAGNEISATDTKYTAGTNVSISDQNVISATDTTYTHFTGATASTDGVQGLVPGPLAGDEDKFLKADGTWDTVQAGSSYTAGDGINISAQDVISATNTGKAKELTTDDYNYPNASGTTADCIALWLLEPGTYSFRSGVMVKASILDTYGLVAYGIHTCIVGQPKNNGRRCIVCYNSEVTTSNPCVVYYIVDSNGAQQSKRFITDVVIEDTLTSTANNNALSANQGKVLKDLVDSLAIRGAGAPTTSTVGSVGTLYEDTTNGKLYQCTDTTGGSYTWVEVGAGGGSTYTAGNGIDITNAVISATNTGKARVLTSADYNYHQFGDTDNAVGLWLLEPGIYCAASGTAVRIRSNVSATTGATWIVGSDSGVYKAIAQIDSTNQPGDSTVYWVNKTTGGGAVAYPLITPIRDNLTSTDTDRALSANQGKVLKDLIDSLVIKNAGAPTTATVGTVGKLYEDTTNGKLYICTAADTVTPSYTWEEVGAGGSGPTVVQTTGTSTTDVMSQNAVTSMVFADPSTKASVRIGAGATIRDSGRLAIGNNAVASNYLSAAIGAGTASGYYSVSLFTEKSIDKPGSIGLGKGATVTRNGEMNIGDSTGYYAHNGSNYRILSGLYDPEEAHDAATKGYVDPSTDSSAPTTATVGRLGQIQIDTTNNDAYMCVAADDVTPAYTWKKITV